MNKSEVYIAENYCWVWMLLYKLLLWRLYLIGWISQVVVRIIQGIQKVEKINFCMC